MPVRRIARNNFGRRLVPSRRSRSMRKRFQNYQTPDATIDRMLKLAGPVDNRLVLEPSAGEGAIASRLLEAGAEVHCREIRAAACAALLATGIRDVIAGDFLSMQPLPEYDAVVMNPPFAADQDLFHILHAYWFLKPGGVLVAVASPWFTFINPSRVRKHFMAWLRARGGSYRKVPHNSFVESGTSMSTVLIRVVKEEE